MVGVSFSGKVDQGLAHLLGQRGRSMVLGVGAFDVAFEVIADHDNAGITGFERDTVFVFDFGSLVGEGVTTVEADGEYVAILHLWIPVSRIFILPAQRLLSLKAHAPKRRFRLVILQMANCQ